MELRIGLYNTYKLYVTAEAVSLFVAGTSKTIVKNPVWVCVETSKPKGEKEREREGARSEWEKALSAETSKKVAKVEWNRKWSRARQRSSAILAPLRRCLVIREVGERATEHGKARIRKRRDRPEREREDGTQKYPSAPLSARLTHNMPKKYSYGGGTQISVKFHTWHSIVTKLWP